MDLIETKKKNWKRKKEAAKKNKERKGAAARERRRIERKVRLTFQPNKEKKLTVKEG